MLLIISLIIVALFIYFLKDSLKKYANIFYIGVAVISIAVFLLEFLSMPLFVKNNILGIFAKGSLGTAMFVAVMYAGALPKGSKLIAPLMKIRGELSITAAILVLCHNFTYGMTYFRMLFTKTSLLSATQLAAAVISLVLIAIMLVLTVTSFPSVRKKMQAKKWKQLQRTAYVFYGLMYVHIMLINIPYARLGLGMYIANVVIYSIVFLGYAYTYHGTKQGNHRPDHIDHCCGTSRIFRFPSANKLRCHNCHTTCKAGAKSKHKKLQAPDASY